MSLFRLVNIGRGKACRDVECTVEQLYREVKKHLASGNIDILWNDDGTEATVAAGFHSVGKVIDLSLREARKIIGGGAERGGVAMEHECKLPETARPGDKFTCVECGTQFEYISDCVYGFPCVENPHDFSPDGESCTAGEIAFWEDAKKRWDAGERDVRGARCKTLTNDQGEYRGHITRTSWGIGVNSYECWENVTEAEAVEGE